MVRCIRSRAVRLAGMAALLATSAAAQTAPGQAPAALPELLVANFDSGRKPNNLGGDFGAWIKDPNDPSQGAVEAFDGDNAHGGKGNALRLIYSVQSSRSAYGGLWMRLQNLDATRFDTVSFRIRGDARLGFTKVLKVELKDSADQASHVYVRTVTDRWQDLAIPLKDFQGQANPARLKEFVIVIEDSSATARQGVLYFDDIRFTAPPPR